MKTTTAILSLAMFPLCIFAAGPSVAAPADTISSLPTAKGATPTQYEGYSLVWNDEFDTDGSPSDAWSYQNGFVRNEELQWYQPQNATVQAGCLVIEGRKERVANPNYQAGSSNWRTSRPYADYTSSCLTTSKSFCFRYGRMEVRAKIPTASGSWPAIWLVGTDWEWPNNGEIDVMEYYIRGVPSILANACWGSARRNEAIWNTGAIPFTHFTDRDANWADKFHVWRMDWDEQSIAIYLDGELLNEIKLADTFNKGCNGNTENPFTTDKIKHFILLNLALGQSGGTPDEAKFPLRYYVDYVRVYQAR